MPLENHNKCRWIGRVFALLAAACAPNARADELPWGAYDDSSSWQSYVPQLEYLKTDVEVQQSSYKLVGGATRDWDTLSVMPSMGIKLEEFVYHPDLLTYRLVFEPGYDYERSGASGSETQTKELMLDGSANISLLAVKPYSTSITFARSYGEEQSDFFEAQTVEQQDWNVISGYRAGLVPVTLTFSQSNEDRTGDDSDFVTDQQKVGLHAFNDRSDSDTTVLDYQYNRYFNQSTTGTSGYSSTSRSQIAVLTDTEHFSKGTLASSVNFNQRDMEGVSSTDINGFFNYDREVTPNLRFFATDSQSDSFGDGYDALENYLTVGINHQLFKSLSSHLDIHGSYSGNNSDGTDLTTASYGIAASEGYNKRLGDWGHISVSNSVAFDVTNQTSSGGNVIVPDESDAIPATGPMIIRLKTPLVVSITSITKNNDPLDASEWKAITTTDPWQIQFFSGGSHSLANGDTIVVTYVVRTNPTGSYSTTNYAGEIEFRFWQDQAGVRLNYITTENHTSSTGFVLQNIEQYQVGGDVGWNDYHADASYTNQQSTLYSYRNYSLAESYSRPLFLRTTFGVNFYQQWNDFPTGSNSAAGQPQNIAFFSYMLHSDWRPRGWFGVSAEAGLQQQRGTDLDQNLLAARVYLNWTFTKLEIHLGYEHENLQYVGDIYTRNYAFVKMRRSF